MHDQTFDYVKEMEGKNIFSPYVRGCVSTCMSEIFLCL